METARTLADVLAERGWLASPELEALFVALLGELEQLHARGVIHGDIRPARIVSSGSGTWSLAAPVTSRVGVPKYMSPERVRAEALDARSDIYALGVVLFEAATGRVPFTGDVNAEIMDAHLNREPDMPSAIRPGIPSQLEGIILKALAKGPEKRFQTAAEFRAALNALVSQTSVPPAARPRTAEKQGATRTDRRRQATSPSDVNSPRPEAGPRPAAATVAQPRPTAATPLRARRMSGVWAVILLAAALAVGGYLLFGVILARPVVPDVAGLTPGDAEAVLIRAGFKPERVSDIDDTVMAGRVARQSILAGTKMPRGTVVHLSTSTGMVEMPDLTGVPLDEAVARLKVLKLDLVRTELQYNDKVSARLVIQTSIRPQARVRPGAGVTLTVCGGRATCANCGAARASGARFCVVCGRPFVD